MDNSPLVTSLIVSGIGMLFLFLALALLCGLMYLMTAFIKDRPKPAPPTLGEEEYATSKGAQEWGLRQRRAAVIAVALARAEQALSAPTVPPVEEAATAWQMFHRQRQLTMRLRTRRTR